MRTFTAIVVSSLASAAFAQLTPQDVAKLRSVTSAVMSPDGEHIAYTLLVPRELMEEDDGPAWAELHVVDRDGTSLPFVTGKVNVSAVAWRPDGGQISFLAERDGDEHRSVYAIALAGGEAKPIVEHGADITAYSWAPDGTRIALLAEEREDEEAKELEDKGFDQIIYEEDWRPTRVWVLDLEKDAAPRLLEHNGHASAVHFSPDGTKLATVIAPTALVDHSLVRQKVHVLDATEGTLLARVQNPGKLGHVAWSPDGEHIALVSAADVNDPAAGRLMVVPATGGEPRDLMPSYDDGHVETLHWIDATTLGFVMSEGVETFYARIDADGSKLEKLVPKGNVVLERVTLSHDGSRAAFVADGPTHPAEVYLNTDGGLRRLTSSNPWLADRRLAPQEVVRFTARDGLELEGVLVRPLDEVPGERYPLILTVHGGPESHFSNGWVTTYSNPGHVGATRGFAVFYPNYRGSTGRGVRFSKHGHADAAGPEFDDLVDAVDHLITTGLVDRDKVGITGGSYGGYASAWGATYYTERFAAAVMFVGISDNISKVGTTDIPEEMFLVHHRKWLYDDWDYFLKRSPIYYVKQARTPTLILAGEDDPRVHPSQSLELYRHLKVLGNAPTRLVFYKGEGHGNRRAASRYDYNLRMLRWMEHYLKGPGGQPPDYRLDYELGASAKTKAAYAP